MIIIFFLPPFSIYAISNKKIYIIEKQDILLHGIFMKKKFIKCQQNSNVL